MAQPRNQRDASRASNSSGSGREPFFNDAQTRTPPQQHIPFIPQQQQNPLSFLSFQRPGGQVPLMGGGMPMMNMNPMAMSLGMQGFNQLNGMNMMGMNGMNAMGMMGNMSGMPGVGNMGAMRLGMGPMGGVGGSGSAGAGGGTGGMGRLGMMGGAAAMNAGYGRAGLNMGVGPSRVTSRGQHNFHPYTR